MVAAGHAPPKTQSPPLNGEPTLERPQRRMNRRSPWAASATQGERIERQLLRGSERDLELEGDTRRRVELVVAGLGWMLESPRKSETLGSPFTTLLSM